MWLVVVADITQTDWLILGHYSLRPQADYGPSKTKQKALYIVINNLLIANVESLWVNLKP